MALFTRRERPPADLVRGVEPGERVLSWADTDDEGGAVVATSRGMRWPDLGETRLIPWERIDKAVWRDGVLTIIEADVVDDLVLVDRSPVSLHLVRPRDLPPTVRKRVEANIVRTELVTIGGGAVRFVARKQPGRDGVRWWARLEPGTRDTDQVRSAIRARLAILRAAAEPER